MYKQIYTTEPYKSITAIPMDEYNYMIVTMNYIGAGSIDFTNIKKLTNADIKYEISSAGGYERNIILVNTSKATSPFDEIFRLIKEDIIDTYNEIISRTTFY